MCGLDFCSLNVPYIANSGPVEATAELFLSLQITYYLPQKCHHKIYIKS